MVRPATSSGYPNAGAYILVRIGIKDVERAVVHHLPQQADRTGEAAFTFTGHSDNDEHIHQRAFDVYHVA